MSEFSMIVTLSVAPEAKNAVRAALQKLVPITQAEAGCLRYDCHEVDPDGFPGVANTGGDFVMLETWRDSQAQQSHGASAHFQEFITAFSQDELQLSVQLLKNA